MLIKEELTIDNVEFIRTYSDKHFYIRGGEPYGLYAEAQDVAKDKVFYGADGARVIGTAEEEPAPTGTLSITENGTYDVTNYANAEVNVSGGGELDETTLWTNPSPRSAFTAGNQTMTESMANFEFIKFIYKETTSTSTKVVLIPYSYFRLYSGKTYLYLGSAGYKRSIQYTSDTTIYFNQATGANNNSTSNSFIIPVGVYGVKRK